MVCLLIIGEKTSMNPELPFKYVGEEKYLSIYETKQSKCHTCGMNIVKEERLEYVLVTYVEITKLSEGKVRVFATLQGHKILDKNIEEPFRWTL